MVGVIGANRNPTVARQVYSLRVWKCKKTSQARKWVEDFTNVRFSKVRFIIVKFHEDTLCKV